MPSAGEVRPPDRKFFEDAIKQAFDSFLVFYSLPPDFVFGTVKRRGGSREKYFTDFMKADWRQCPSGLVIGGGSGREEREVDLARRYRGDIVSSCELKVYPIKKLKIGKAFTMLSDAVLKQMIRQDLGIQAIPYVAIVLDSKITLVQDRICEVGKRKALL
jgi:hypothetical protein